MLRILLTIVLPIALPLIVYILYVKTMRNRHGPGPVPPPSPLGVWLVLGTSVVFIAGMLTLGFSRGVPPGTKLVAPHMENGEVIPSQRLDEAQ